MRDMFSYTQAAVERAMKVQEVISRALAKEIRMALRFVLSISSPS
jgi:hypothetical protein